MFFLEAQETRTVKMPYSYERRALGTLTREQWKQHYACEDKQPLVDLLKGFRPGKYRISSNNGSEPQEFVI